MTEQEQPVRVPPKRSPWAVAALVAGFALVLASMVGFVTRATDAEVPARDDEIVIADAGGEALHLYATTTTTTTTTSARPVATPPPTTVAPPPPVTTTVAPDHDLAAVAVRIPDVGIDSRLIPLGLNPDQTLQVPQDFSVAGWYIYRPVPGAMGPGIIAGHVDSKRGKAVFYEVRHVEPGMSIEVDRSDGTTAYFTVTAKEQHDKDDFPTDRVYGATAGPELRVITCGGHFDRRIGHYDDNIVLFATLDRIG